MTFDPAIYERIRQGSIESAAVCVPMILHQIETERPRCLDVGAGEGWWSEALWNAGAGHVDSIDHPVPEHTAEGVTVLDVDLEGGAYQFQRGYDLALCLEVAEHLTPDAGDELVRQLCRSCRAIAWSAAIPHQGGSGHQNEQWPDYWQERFARWDFALMDPWRDALWMDSMVEPWYQQNLLLAVPASYEQPPVRPLVHPAFYLSRVAERDAQ